jgi:hypothetical protein
MIVEFLPEAKSELLDAIEYYEGQLDGLGTHQLDRRESRSASSKIRRLSTRKLRNISVLRRLYYSRSHNLGLVHRTRAAFPNIGLTEAHPDLRPSVERYAALSASLCLFKRSARCRRLLQSRHL